MKDLVLSNGERNLTETDFKDVERKIGFNLPKEMKELYFSSNGGDPLPNTWVDSDGKWDDIEIRDFFPFVYKADQDNNEYFTADGIAAINWRQRTLPDGLLPFACDWGGNYFCIDLRDGNIFYYTRDSWDENIPPEKNFAKNLRKINNSFLDFIRNINRISE